MSTITIYPCTEENPKFDLSIAKNIRPSKKKIGLVVKKNNYILLSFNQLKNNIIKLLEKIKKDHKNKYIPSEKLFENSGFSKRQLSMCLNWYRIKELLNEIDSPELEQAITKVIREGNNSFKNNN